MSHVAFRTVLWAAVCVGCFTGQVYAHGCSQKQTCVKTVKEPYYQRVCSNKRSCLKIHVTCGPPGDRFKCAFDEICMRYNKQCAATKGGKDPIDCAPEYRCEWKPYWEIDRELFEAPCTEYYTLRKNQTCGDAMAKFFLPWKVFIGFNPTLDCKTAKEGDAVCVHAFVRPKRPICGKERCKIGERCVQTDCVWRPRFGDKCGSFRCPLGYACSYNNCKKPKPETHGKLSFVVKASNP